MKIIAPEAMGVVYRMPISDLHPHPLNPYVVRDDLPMQELIESVQKSGVLVPAIARPMDSGGYQLISGHRRKKQASFPVWTICLLLYLALLMMKPLSFL